ncbi:hypothetical protein ACFQX7_35390 [Luedemannella flava]
MNVIVCQLVVAAALTLGAGTAAAAPVPDQTATTVTVNFAAKTVKSGTSVTFAGKVDPASAARTVWLQRNDAGAWRTIGTARTARAAYKVTIKPAKVRTDRYRVVAPGTAKANTGISRTTTVTVRAATVVRGNPKAFAFMYPGRARWNPCTPIGYRVNLTQATSGALTDVKGALARITAVNGCASRTGARQTSCRVAATTPTPVTPSSWWRGVGPARTRR